MNPSVNVVTIMGRLGADPELKGSGDTRFVSLRVATSESKLVGRNWVEDTHWHTVKVWGQTVGNLCQRAKKGTLIHVTGKLTSHIYQEKRYWEIRCRRWIIVADGRKMEAKPGSSSDRRTLGARRLNPRVLGVNKTTTTGDDNERL